MFVTKPYPLQLFISLQERLAVQYANEQARLADLLKSVVVSVDTFKSLEVTLERRRAEVVETVTGLESLHFLTAILKSAIRRAELSANVPDLRDRIEYYEANQLLWATHLAHQPSRSIPEQEIQALQLQINELKTAGTAESAISQRNSLRSHQVHLPILGREDLRDRRIAADRMQVTLDVERADLQQLMAQTRFSIEVPDALGPMLSSLGFDGQHVSETQEANSPEPNAGNASDPANA